MFKDVFYSVVYKIGNWNYFRSFLIGEWLSNNEVVIKEI